jgi:23S rRNA (cytidine1920-2'-O)/16S rRNA (cytidine1409-2'-O)-methyltransferase
MVCADIGSSTGGFTDCLLSRGAKKVYAVDLNDDLLDESLKTDERVFFLLKNARNLILKDFNESLDFIVGDLSFISLSLIFPVLSNLMKENSFALFLIKPQFELGEKRKLKNGIITDDATRKEILKKVCDYAIKNDLVPQNITTAPIVKGKNVEYLILLKKCKESAIPIDFLINF